MNINPRSIFQFLICFLVSSSLLAQTTSIKKSPPLSEATPQSVGISPERLKKLDAMLEESIKNEELPGLVALIVRNGMKVVQFGLADRQPTSDNMWIVAAK